MNAGTRILAGILLWGLATQAFPAAEPAAPVRVMSFNIRYGTANDGDNNWVHRRDLVAETILAYKPDLLGTQETLADQRDFLASKLPGYAVVSAGRDDGKEKGEMAALFYRKDRFEQVDGGTFWLSESPEKVGVKGWDAALPSVVTWVKLRERQNAAAKPLLFVNSHFDHRGTKARTESARLIRTRLEELGKGCSLVVTGDFNAGEGSEPYRALLGRIEDRESPLVDTFRQAHPKRGDREGTFHGFKPSTPGTDRIDWIAASRDWTVLGAAIDRTEKVGRAPSDHFPVTAELRR